MYVWYHSQFQFITLDKNLLQILILTSSKKSLLFSQFFKHDILTEKDTWYYSSTS